MLIESDSMKYTQNKRSVGNQYEKMAGEYLKQQGYQILEYNFYSRNGEVDIVAIHEGYLVFIEVKYRTNDKVGHPLEAVSVSKQKSICKCAAFYIKKNGFCDVPIRFDVVGILGDKIQVLQNAFDFIL